MITVKIQMVYLPVRSDFLVDITDRILPGSLKRISERLEDGRFAFRITDLNIDLNNFDNYWYRPNRSQLEGEKTWAWITSTVRAQNYEGGGNVYYGATFVVYDDGVEIYRGDAGYKDFSFDIINKTVSVRTYSWHSRLRNIDVEIDDFGYSLDDLLSQLIAALINEDTDYYKRRYFDGYDFDISGVLDLDFSSIHGGTQLGAYNGETETYQIDVYRDVGTGKIYGMTANSMTIRDIRTMNIYLLRDNGYSHIKEISIPKMSIDGALTEPNIGSAPVFVPCRTGYLGIAYKVDGHGSRDLNPYTGIQIINLESLSVTHRNLSYDTNIEHIGLPAATSARDYGKRTITDGYFIYTTEPAAALQTLVTRYTIGAVPSGTWNVECRVHSRLHGIYRGKFAWHEWYDQRWRYANWGDSGTIGDNMFLDSMGRTYKNYLVANGKIRPIGYQDDEYNGKFSYWIVPLESDISEFRNFPACNDPIHQIMSCLIYEDVVKVEDVIIDIAQCFNAYYTLQSGIIGFYNRGTYSETHTISEDWIANKDYKETHSELLEVSLKITSTGFYDESEHPYSDTFILGIIRTYYKEQIGLWVDKTLVIPAEVGNSIHLSDEIHINETGMRGIVTSKEWEDAKTGKMTTFKIESQYEL